MYISELLHYCKEDHEADVCVSDGHYSVVCYVYSLEDIFVGQRVSSIIAFGCDNILRCDKTAFVVEQLPQQYKIAFTAQVVSRDKAIVRIGEIVIDLDSNIPGDIRNGEYISCNAIRLDAIIGKD